MAGLAFSRYYPLTIRLEEALMTHHHGAAFTFYCLLVPSFWSNMRGNGNADLFPSGLDSQARIYFTYLTSADWLPIFCGVVHRLGCGHELGLIRTWIELP